MANPGAPDKVFRRSRSIQPALRHTQQEPPLPHGARQRGRVIRFAENGYCLILTDWPDTRPTTRVTLLSPSRVTWRTEPNPVSAPFKLSLDCPVWGANTPLNANEKTLPVRKVTVAVPPNLLPSA